MKPQPFAKHLRQHMTDAEHLLWRHLRAHRFADHKFRRQQPLGPYIVDFVNLGARLIVEADGGQHAESVTDQRRDAWLQAQGFRLRFWNDDVLLRTESVLDAIWLALQAPPLPQPLPREGEGSNTRSGRHASRCHLPGQAGCLQCRLVHPR